MFLLHFQLICLLHPRQHRFGQGGRIIRLGEQRGREADGENTGQPMRELVQADRFVFASAQERGFDLFGDGREHEVHEQFARIVAEQDAPAQRVDGCPLLVHDVVIFQRALADGEMLLFDPALRAFD